MKKILLSLVITTFFIASYAQTVPGGSFESWDVVSNNRPGDWYTFFANNFAESRLPTITKVAGYNSNNGIRLSTLAKKSNSNQVEVGIISNVSERGITPFFLDGGQPFTEMPTALEGYYSCNMKENDSAVILLVFTKDGKAISSDTIKFGGYQPDYAAFSYPLNLPVEPEMMLMQIMSSDVATSAAKAAWAGNWAQFDELRFTGPGVTQPVFGGDFEKWMPVTFNEPAQWLNGSTSGNVNKSTDAYDGTYALRLETVTDVYGVPQVAIVQNGQTVDNTYGFAHTNKVDTLIGHYKYITSSGTDAAIIRVRVFDLNNSNSKSFSIPLLPTADYRYFEIPYDATSLSSVDKLGIYIASSSGQYGIPEAGSVLYIDKLAFKNGITSVKDTKRSDIFTVYPNPASDVLNINVKADQRSRVNVNIYDTKGSVVLSRSYNIYGNTAIHMPVSSLPAGQYYYDINDGNAAVKNTFIKQ